MFKQLLIILLSASVAGYCLGAQDSSPPPTPQKILIIGNSFTAANGGIDSILNQMGAVTPAGERPVFNALTEDGATLKQLWNTPGIRAAIESGAYDILIVQADIPESDIDTFREYTRRFVGAAQQAGTRPVLLMAWAYERLGWISQDEIAQAHTQIARELGVDVAPVGLAWSRAMEERPALDLYAPDREHPSISGSYLAACVVYATVTGKPATGGRAAGDAETGMDAAVASYLEGLAWDTSRAYQPLPRDRGN